ncbi:MAG: hypothetical protein KAS70_05985 [Planctomycetes bacterium]|nr:hypothetical protein [Planctomycetota bacterium]MCK5578426.1 hypothetical protein [Planctomycetota bacterium]
MTKKIFSWFIKAFTQNLGTKIMAILMATAVWFYFNYEYPEVSPQFNVPLQLELPANIISSRIETIEGGPLGSLKVTLQGPPGALNNIPTNIICRHKITGVDVTLNKPQVLTEKLLGSDFINLPSQTKIKSFEPAKIKITLVNEESKVMRVNTENSLRGKPAEGYRITKVQITPSEILVRGPKNTLNKYRSVNLHPVNVSGRTVSFSQPGRIQETLDGQKIVTTDKFVIKVHIEETFVVKSFKPKINILLPSNFPYKIRIKPEKIDLKLEIPYSVTDKFNEHHFNLFIDVSRLYSQITDVKPGMTYNAQLEFRLTPDAPGRDKITKPENLTQIKLDVLKLTPPEKPPGE